MIRIQPPAPTLKVYIATPTFNDSVGMDYHLSVTQLIASQRNCHVLQAQGQRFVIEDRWYPSTDVVRARSIIVHKFLETDGTHLLFIDSDISFDPNIVPMLLSKNVDVIGCPYPKKDIDWEKATKAARAGRTARDGAMTYVALHDGGHHTGDTVEVLGLGMGFTLISRACLERMTKAYASLAYHDGDSPPIVALFNLMLEPDDDPVREVIDHVKGNLPRLFSEDFSFCRRWRKLGGKVYMFVVPVSHSGMFTFEGTFQGMLED